MKKTFTMIAAIIILCGASLFTSCSDDKEDSSHPSLAEKLVGKWLYVEADGEKVDTKESSVSTFVMEGSTLKAYISISMMEYDLWAFKQPMEVAIDGDKMTLTMHAGDITTVEEASNITITDEEMSYTSTHTVMRNGKVIESDTEPCRVRCVKVHDDYSQIIVGRWEGSYTSDKPGFEPQPFCEEYLADGTFIGYSLVDGQWVPEEEEYAQYFVDGNLMCTRWKIPGSEEERENCIFESYENGILTVKEVVESNGHIYTETSTLTKVNMAKVKRRASSLALPR